LLGKLTYAQRQEIKTLESLHAEQRAQLKGVVGSQEATIKALRAGMQAAERAVRHAQQVANNSQREAERLGDEIQRLKAAQPEVKSWADTALPAGVKRLLSGTKAARGSD